MIRRKSKVIKIGTLAVGGDYPIIIQSMTNTKTCDIQKTVEQIHKLEKTGCQLVRVAVPDMESAKSLGKIKSQINIPLVADIHFDYRLAIEAINEGVDKLRINPGNILNKEKRSQIIKHAKDKNIPIRIGINAGSVPPKILQKYNNNITHEALFESAMEEITFIESFNYNNIIISVKAYDIFTTLNSYKMLAQKVDYPFHIGITEAGTLFSGTIHSSVGLGILLYEGLGDTIRVSLSADPCHEVRAAKQILKSLGLKKGVSVISCPTCARTQFDVIKTAEMIEEYLCDIEFPIKIAVMGCIVNGPGEAKHADIGITGKGKDVMFFKDGKIIKKTNYENAITVLLEEIKKMLI